MTRGEILTGLRLGTISQADAQSLLVGLGETPEVASSLIAQTLIGMIPTSGPGGEEGPGQRVVPLTAPAPAPSPSGFNFDTRDILESDPRLAFFGSEGVQDQFSRSASRKNFFQDQFANVHNQFLGSLGSQLRQGELPTQGFSEFLGGFDFNKSFLDQPSAFRSPIGGEARLNPRSRSLFNF
jgi:hypothetical protein